MIAIKVNFTKMETKIRECINSLADIDFFKKEYRIKQRNEKELGRVDYAWRNSKNNLLIIFEYEEEQAHPCTNLLKMWPYLEEFSEERILFIHYFAKKGRNNNSSRMRLAEFLGEKLMEMYEDRFKYCFYYNDECLENIIVSIVGEYKTM